MDLTMPEIPGALLGYRRNGQPIYLAAGGDGSGDEDVDDQTDVDESATDDNATDWKAKYEESEAERKAQVKINKDIEKRYKREARQPATGNDPSDVDERVEAARVAAIERELNAAAKSAAYTVGGDAPKLLDSLAFRRLLDKLDVFDVDEFEEAAAELMREELKKQPKPKQPAKKQGADMSGGQQGRTRPKDLREAFARQYGN